VTTVYLAGKVAKNDWRHDAVLGLRGALGNGPETGAQMPQGEFFVLSTGVRYSGPFFVGCDHGCAHGPSTHGSGNGGCTQTPTTRSDVARRCREGIDRADYVFAWLDDLTAYGTLFEIGLAVGLGKKIWLYTSPDHDHDDLWFAKHSATNGVITYADSAAIAVKDFISKIA
jgi:hypothetical protein